MYSRSENACFAAKMHYWQQMGKKLTRFSEKFIFPAKNASSPLTMGSEVTVGGNAIGAMSGGHLNPAVTFGRGLRRE